MNGRPVPRLTLLFFNAAKVPEAAKTATARTASGFVLQHEPCQMAG